MASTGGGKGYVSIGVAQLAVGSEQHSDSTARPRHNALQAHLQVELVDLNVAPSPHKRGIDSFLMRFTTAPVQTNCFISRS